MPIQKKSAQTLQSLCLDKVGFRLGDVAKKVWPAADGRNCNEEDLFDSESQIFVTSFDMLRKEWHQYIWSIFLTQFQNV